MILFLLKAALLLSILLGFYKLFLQKESFFSANRAYLLIGLTLTFILPFVTLPELVNHQGIVDIVVAETEKFYGHEPSLEEISKFSSEVQKNEIRENLNQPDFSSRQRYEILFYLIILIYFFGVATLFLNLLRQLSQIFLRIKKSKERLVRGRYIILDQTVETEPCSFFNYIFISRFRYAKNTYKQILEHEKIHVINLHSVDLLFAELAIIILWFNPFVWLYRKEVEKNIEYQTDALLVNSKKVDSEDYQMNLLNMASHKHSNTLVSNYNHSLIKKRIIMMNKQKSNKKSYWKYVLLAPTLFVTLLMLNQPYVVNAQKKLSIDFHNEDGYSEEYSHHGDHSDDLPRLHQASADGSEVDVRKLLTSGADVNEIAKGDGTPLYLAMQHDHWEIAKLLLKNGANPNIGSSSDGYPVLLAVMIKDPALIQLLVDYGARVNMDFPGDGNAIIQAAKNGDLSMVMKLVDLGADINHGVKGDGNPLIMAAKFGQLHVVKYLVKIGANIENEVIGDENPLINASEQGHLEVVKFLISKGADVNKVCKVKVNGKIRRQTALSMASKKEHHEVVEYLKLNGATD